MGYTKFSKSFVSFCADYLKSKIKSLWVYFSGVVYTNKLGIYRFITCDNETSENTGRSLRNFIELVELLYSLYSDNHGNFKDGILNDY